MPPYSSRPVVVLLVDDDMDARFIFSTVLESVGYEVVEAHDGAEAVRLARITKPDLVLMDIMMPRMDGIGALHAIRTVFGEQRIPILAVTAIANGGDPHGLSAAGFDEVLFKPILPMRLAAAVDRHVGGPRTRPAHDHSG